MATREAGASKQLVGMKHLMGMCEHPVGMCGHDRFPSTLPPPRFTAPLPYRNGTRATLTLAFYHINRGLNRGLSIEDG